MSAAPRLVKRAGDCTPLPAAGRSDLEDCGSEDYGSRRYGVLRRESVFRWSLAVADVFAATLALLACVTLGDDGLTPFALLALPLVIVVSKLQRLYDRDEMLVNKTTLDQAPQLFNCATFYALLVAVMQSLFIEGTLGAREILVLWATLLLAAILMRGLARWIAHRTIAAERCLFVGSDESYERLRSKLPDGSSRAKLVGRMSMSPGADGLATSAAVLLGRLIDDLGVHRVIIEPNEVLPQLTMDFVREAKATSVRVSLLPRILEVVGSAIEVDDVNGLTLLGVRRFGLSRSSWLLKRGFDVAIASAGLIVLSPLLLFIAILIKLDSRGCVIFRQTRIGRGGKPFEMWKFRTMITGADGLKAQLAAHNGAAGGLFKIADDPRMTRPGRWLRIVSLDELPQLVNVLRGEMSLVGPRPLVSDEDGLINGRDRSRLRLTPGMTGHWQIAGSSRVPLAEMVKLDYLYVAGWTLWTDIRLLLRTIPYVLARRGL
ncbi:MAG TPA: exopolysaccharide biosynthesis polyprenyl glycosylphosphotransferase [Solirubrobacteraceae bacterium]|jgi:exopolysaccharide biosynthesis polyprenyl glycosylphosphotransferase